MVILKGCNRCMGDVYIDDSHDGRDLVCLQCGHRIPQARMAPATVGLTSFSSGRRLVTR